MLETLRADPVYVLAGLCLCVALSEWLARNTPLRHVGTALLVIIVTAIAANVGLMPKGSAPFYDGVVFGVFAPLAIFWLLLGVSLADVRRAGGPMLVMFSVGAVGTVVGVLAGLGVVGFDAFGEHTAALGGMFAGTYIGGSANFNAIALEYGVAKQGTLYAGSVAVDSIMTTLWMIANIAVPRMLARRWPRAAARPAAVQTAQHLAAQGLPPGGPIEADAPLGPGEGPLGGDALDDDPLGIRVDTETAHPLDLALLGVLGAGSLVASKAVAAWCDARGVDMPYMFVLTVLALVFAQLPVVQRLRGGRMLGMFLVYVFLAAIGGYCDLESLAALGDVGGTLFVFAGVLILVHGVICFGAGALFKQDWDVAAVASQANIGGGTSAIALARGLARPDLVLPAILVGSLGTALGNLCGFKLAMLLGA